MAKTTAIVLSAGKGSRMKSKVAKQYLLLEDKPIIVYTLEAFQNSFIDEIILVCGEGDREYCKTEIVERYQLTKVTKIVEGGKERYDSVYNGLKAIGEADYVYIHDGARPFVTKEILERVQQQVEEKKACIVGMPVKDTIKQLDADHKVSNTPDRKTLWQIQTPQVFAYELIWKAYKKLETTDKKNITDDAMVVETMLQHPIYVVEGAYTNIKITTPEDLEVGKVFWKLINNGNASEPHK